MADAPSPLCAADVTLGLRVLSQPNVLRAVARALTRAADVRALSLATRRAYYTPLPYATHVAPPAAAATATAYTVGAVRRGRPCGETTLYRTRDNTPIRRAVYADGGTKHGPSTCWHRNGARAYAVAYVDGKPHGVATAWYKSGARAYTVAYVDGARHGVYAKWYAGGARKSEAAYVHGALHGVCTAWHERGARSCTKTYVDGALHGTVCVWRPNPNNTHYKHSETPYVHGVLHGVAVEWFASGAPRCTKTYVDGALHGTVCVWRPIPNGEGAHYKHAATPYVHGVRHGTAVEWYASGETSACTTYANGARHGLHVKWYASGKKRCATPYVHGVRHGDAYTWHASGARATRTPHVGGVAHGLVKSWYASGALESVSPHNARGQLHGTTTSWREDGTPRIVGDFDCGRLVRFAIDA
jgi:antitoxin component YwqK of YwqJK toxin-antitoxin module